MLSAQAMIAGKFQRQSHDLHRVVGNSHLGQIGLGGGQFQPGGLLQQAAVRQQPAFYLAGFSCTRGRRESGCPRLAGARVLSQPSSQSRAARATPS